MSSVEEIIKRILALRPNLTREAVERLIDEERVKAAGLLTEEAATHLVASNLGLDGAGERIEAKVKIGDLTPGLSDVSITARVIFISLPHTFTRTDGTEGKVLNMLLGDSTGSVTAVFWDNKADQVSASKVAPGKIVRVLHGYSRERRGEIQINVGNRGQIYMEPLDAVENDYPELESFYKTPGEIFTPGTVNLIGVIMDKSPVSKFNRRDGSEGRVARVSLEEGEGRINLVLWDNKVDEIKGMEPGTRIRVTGGNARERQDRSLEVHSNYGTILEVLEIDVMPVNPVPKWTKIGNLRTGMNNVNTVGRITNIGSIREFNRRDGGSGRVISVLLEDETGNVRLSLWDDDVKMVDDIKPSTIISIENGYTRLSLGDIGLNMGQRSKLQINPKDIKIAESNLDIKIVPLGELREGQANIHVRGTVLEPPEVREVETSRGPATVASFRIDDGTGEVRVSFWRDLVNQVEGLSGGTQVRIENCNIREPFDGLLQVSSGMFTRIVVEKK
ncbi:MAG: OB-fold nucleic acid binding domain-containing protein [Candidatus Bathyarchaeota archaeon]|nr:OB-fold nucleic acid binding domain-containing protein [Candidatus Bathyarchaeota archaeon]